MRRFARRVVDGQRRRHFHLASHLRHAMRLADGMRHGLLAEHVLVLAHGRDGDGGVPVVRCCHVHGVQIFFFGQQFAIIAIGVAAFVRAGIFVRAVVGFHQSLGRLAAAHAETARKLARELHRSGRGQVFAPFFVALAEQAAGGAQQRVGAVLDVILAALVAIANRDHLDFGARQQSHGDVLALAAEADGRNG